VLAERYRNAYERSERSLADWIEATIEMAVTLREARDDHFNNHRAFSIWLAENDLNFHNDHDRAALINMGRNVELTRIVLQETRSTSPQLIWRDEIQPRSLASASKSRPEGIQSPESVPTAAPGPPKEPQVLPAQDPQPESNLPEQPKTQRKSRRSKESSTLGERHPFYGWSRADEVAAIYSSGTARWHIGKLLKKRGGKQLWELILLAMDAGFLQPHDGHPAQPNIRLLFPQTPPIIAGDYLLDSPKIVSDLHHRIMPILLANRDAFLAAPDQFQLIVKKHEEDQRRQAIAQQLSTKMETARQSLPAHEPEVILYGKHFWPIVNISDPDQRYDYQQLQAAAWAFDDALKLARSSGDNSAKSCAIKIRFLMKPFKQFNDRMLPIEVRKRWRQVFGLIDEMTRAMQDAGFDGAIGNRLPYLPPDRSDI
jgi:hypothetical protein